MHLIAHPNTAKKIYGQLGKLTVDGQEIPIKEWSCLTNIKITENQYVRESIDEEWVPPKGDKFFQLDKSDECWAKDLGLGEVRKIDPIPVIMQINERVMEKLYKDIFAPLPIQSSFPANQIRSYDFDLPLLTSHSLLLASF